MSTRYFFILWSSRKAEDRDDLIAGRIRSFLIPLKAEVALQAAAAANRPTPRTASKHSKTAKRRLRRKGSLAALCTHLGINIGVKGPTAFELFLVYRALGGGNRS